MIKRLISLCLFCLLLCGCAGSPSPEAASPTLPLADTVISPAEPVSLYDARSAIEQRTRGAVRAFPLSLSDAAGLKAMGEALLVFSGKDATTLTLLTGEELRITASAQLDFLLDPADPSVTIGEDFLSYYDPSREQTVILDEALREISHITAPDDLLGSPILSLDRATLYYCTSTAIRAWDLQSGIRRCVKEMAYSNQRVTGLYNKDSIIACTISDGTDERVIYVSAGNGRLIRESRSGVTLTTHADRYYAAFPTGMTQALLFGTGEEAPQALTPADIPASCVFLEQADSAVTFTAVSDEEVRFDYYELSTGLRRSSLTIPSPDSPTALEDTTGGSLYILMYSTEYGCDTLYRWDISQMLLNDGTVYTGPYYTADDPDYAGLAQCQAYADEIGDTYGIRILLWEDAAAAAPWDYDFEVEYLTAPITYELELLQQRLTQFPQGMLEATASNFSGLTICLVRQITGTTDVGSVDTANGLQYFLDNQAYIALAVGELTEQALYHELFHVMETHILNNSIAFDQWEKLNPKGFQYDLDYQKNQSRDGSEYMREETRSFIDTYSMSFPKEDRARIMEYACTSGMEAYFQSEPMQAKLKTLCEGIREAYGLEKSPETYLWEQYLMTSLAYTK